MDINRKQISFQVIPGDKSIYEIWKCEEGNRMYKLGIINDLNAALSIVESLQYAYR